MTSLRVLFVTAWYPNLSNPIEGVFVREHAKAVATNNTVAVLHLVRSEGLAGEGKNVVRESDESLTEGIVTFRVHHRPPTLPGVATGSYWLNSWRGWRHVVREHFRPDVIHANVFDAAWPVALIARWNRIPIVVTEHWSGFPLRILTRRQIITARLAFGLADRVLPVSDALRSGIERYGLRARFHVVPNVVDTSNFHLPTSPCQGAPRFLFVGGLDRRGRKGLPILLRALSWLKDREWELDVVGSGPGESSARTLTSELGLSARVHFHGSVSHANVSHRMQAASFLLLPSLWENLPCAAIEALACGLPVIASNVGGIPEVVGSEDGVLVPPEDERTLKEAIEAVLDTRIEFDRSEISKRAHDRYSYASVAASLDRIYRDVISERARK